MCAPSVSLVQRSPLSVIPSAMIHSLFSFLFFKDNLFLTVTLLRADSLSFFLSFSMLFLSFALPPAFHSLVCLFDLYFENPSPSVSSTPSDIPIPSKKIPSDIPVRSQKKKTKKEAKNKIPHEFWRTASGVRRLRGPSACRAPEFCCFLQILCELPEAVEELQGTYCTRGEYREYLLNYGHTLRSSTRSSARLAIKRSC